MSKDCRRLKELGRQGVAAAPEPQKEPACHL